MLILLAVHTVKSVCSYRDDREKQMGCSENQSIITETVVFMCIYSDARPPGRKEKLEESVQICS